MTIPIPGGPSRSPSPARQEDRRAQGGSRAAKPASEARFTLAAAEHSGTLAAAMGTCAPRRCWSLRQPTAVIFTLNQDSSKTASERNAGNLL